MPESARARACVCFSALWAATFSCCSMSLYWNAASVSSEMTTSTARRTEALRVLRGSRFSRGMVLLARGAAGSVRRGLRRRAGRRREADRVLEDLLIPRPVLQADRDFHRSRRALWRFAVRPRRRTVPTRLPTRPIVITNVERFHLAGDDLVMA